MFGSAPTEGKVGDFQYALAEHLYNLDKELGSREAELKERGLTSELGEVQRVISRFSASAAQGVAGFEQTKAQLEELVEALKALSSTSLKQ